MDVKEFEKKYGDVRVKFDYYYKYQFYFVGKDDDGTKIECIYGGSAHDIYKFEVASDLKEKVGVLDEKWMTVQAKFPDGTKFEWYE